MVWPEASLIPAVMIIAKMPRMNAYVGMANRVPDSRTPRRFIRVIRKIMATVREMRCSPNHGMAEATLAEAAEVETATVRM